MRLSGFDYARPYFYMVTLKRNAGYPALSRISDDPAAHWLEPNEITFLFSDVIKTFHETWRCIKPIECFSIMPDHIHLLIKIRDVEKRVSLGVIVRMLARASRIGPGGAGVSTFMSPLEKACGNAIARAGGAWVVLSPEGFSPRWHPPRQKEKFCAAGRMLFLSLYEERAKQPTNAELYARCHEMVDFVGEELSV